MQLTEQFHLPQSVHDVCGRLTTLVERHARRLLADEYWSDRHINAIGSQSHNGQSYTYIRDDNYEAFADVEEYLYSRFERCVYQRVTQILDAHAEEFQAFQFVTDTIAERKIKRIGWQRIRNRLFGDPESPYIEWGIIESVIEQLNAYFDRHGRFPDSYTDLVDCPEPNGTLPYAPDRGDYYIHEVTYDANELVVTLNAPETLSPDTYHDWTDHTLRFETHDRFRKLVSAGELRAPTLHATEHGYTLDLPVAIPESEIETSEDRVLAVDLGVKKQATCVPLAVGDAGEYDQVAPPTFLDHHAKDKLFRLKADAEGVDNRLTQLRKQGRAHTDRFDHLLSEYRQIRRKERRLREQIQHDLANQLVWIAVTHGCQTIVFESLAGLEAHDTSGSTAWSISSWARGDLLENVAYKATLLGVATATVNPWGTSRHCPRCGERGKTVKAPTNHTECRHGGHFYCPSCGYECDRDVVGAINVGRKFLGECKIEQANPAVYRAAGNHASFPSRTPSESSNDGDRARSTGVQSRTETESVSSRESQLARHRATVSIAMRGGTDLGGLQQNHGTDTGWRCPSGSVIQYVLTRATDCG